MKSHPKHLSLAGLIVLAGSQALAQVAGPPPPPAVPEHLFVPKVSVYSEYEFRGISQTAGEPAIQLNVDYTHSGGFYLGAFATNIKWLKEAAKAGGFSTDGRMEIDLFGGYRRKVGETVTLDVGYVRYQYPSSPEFDPSPNTDEFYAGLSAGQFSAKYSHATSTLFGFASSKNSGFVELNWAREVIPRLSLSSQIARQNVKNNADFSYTVVKVGASYALGRGFSLGAYGKGTNAKEGSYTVLGEDLGKTTVVAFLSRSF